MPLYTDEAVVLRTHKLGEADRIITLLTRHHGRIRAVAKGIRRTTSRFGARLEPCSYLDVQLATGRSLDIVTQAETRHPYGERIADDYGRYTAAAAMLETAERLTVEEHEPATQHFLLLVGALRAVAERTHDLSLVLDSYFLRSLAIAGYAPSFDSCARCGREGPHRAFAPGAGGMVCADCRPAGVASPAAGTVTLLAALLTGDWPVAERAEARCRREATGLVSAYLHWHLERALRSLPMVERGGPAGPGSAGSGSASAGAEDAVELEEGPVEPEQGGVEEGVRVAGVEPFGGVVAR